jgi:hypothetical protein
MVFVMDFVINGLQIGLTLDVVGTHNGRLLTIDLHAQLLRKNPGGLHGVLQGVRLSSASSEENLVETTVVDLEKWRLHCALGTVSFALHHLAQDVAVEGTSSMAPPNILLNYFCFCSLHFSVKLVVVSIKI